MHGGSIKRAKCSKFPRNDTTQWGIGPNKYKQRSPPKAINILRHIFVFCLAIWSGVIPDRYDVI